MRKIILFLFLIPCLSFSQTVPAKEIISRFLKSATTIKSAKFTLHTEERLMNGKFEIADRLVKYKTNPKKIYFYSLKPNAGTEIIWKEGWQEEKMMVSPGSFPYVTFSMKPNSSLARKDSHHSIMSLGFEYVSSMVQYYIDQYGDAFYDFVSIQDTIQWDGRSCVHMIFDFRDFKYVDYTVQKNETVMSIAHKFHLNDYSILMVNRQISDYDDVKAGQKIKIPNFYNRKIEFYIDRFTWLPLRQLIYDPSGLYEKYEMKSFFLNPTLGDDEFSPDYKDYKF